MFFSYPARLVGSHLMTFVKYETPYNVDLRTTGVLLSPGLLAFLTVELITFPPPSRLSGQAHGSAVLAGGSWVRASPGRGSLS